MKSNFADILVSPVFKKSERKYLIIDSSQVKEVSNLNWGVFEEMIKGRTYFYDKDKTSKYYIYYPSTPCDVEDIVFIHRVGRVVQTCENIPYEMKQLLIEFGYTKFTRKQNESLRSFMKDGLPTSSSVAYTIVKYTDMNEMRDMVTYINGVEYSLKETFNKMYEASVQIVKDKVIGNEEESLLLTRLMKDKSCESLKVCAILNKMTLSSFIIQIIVDIGSNKKIIPGNKGTNGDNLDYEVLKYLAECTPKLSREVSKELFGITDQTLKNGARRNTCKKSETKWSSNYPTELDEKIIQCIKKYEYEVKEDDLYIRFMQKRNESAYEVTMLIKYKGDIYFVKEFKDTIEKLLRKNKYYKVFIKHVSWLSPRAKHITVRYESLKGDFLSSKELEQYKKECDMCVANSTVYRYKTPAEWRAYFIEWLEENNKVLAKNGYGKNYVYFGFCPLPDKESIYNAVRIHQGSRARYREVISLAELERELDLRAYKGRRPIDNETIEELREVNRKMYSKYHYKGDEQEDDL